MKLQALVIDKLITAIENGGGIATIEKDYANTGYVMALDDNLDIEWSIRFDFQTTYFTLELYHGTPQFTTPLHRSSTINGATNSSVIAGILDGMAK